MDIRDRSIGQVEEVFSAYAHSAQVRHMFSRVLRFVIPVLVLVGLVIAYIWLKDVLSFENVEGWFQAGGYAILFGLLFACGLGLPLPEDIPLMLGGYFVALGKMKLVPVAVLAWCGIIGGDCMLYWLSRRYGMNVTKLPLIGSHVTEQRILWAEAKFEQYGFWVVAICRMFAGVRGAMVIAAGVLRYNFLKFIIADGIAAIFSGGLFVYLGWLAGRWFGSLAEMRERIKDYEYHVIAGVVVVVALVLAYFLWWRRRHRPLSEAAADRVEHIVERVAHKVHPPPAPSNEE